MADQVQVYWSLFQGAFPEEWKSDPDFASYMNELTSYSIEKLQSEPSNIKEEKRFVLNSTQKLAFNNYKAFIETAECSREIFKEFVAVEDHVHRLLRNIPKFSEACREFSTESQKVISKRKLNSLALSRHTQLLEILEIPQVMETCVRNGYYEEALDLNNHVKRVEKRHGGIPIIKAIGLDVKECMDLMLHQLLQQLRGSIQLPACLRVVGFLRRMNVFSDVELRLKFLQTRDSWFQGVIAAIPRESSYNHISKVIELSRVHLFDIVTQYRAIFPDDDSAKVSYPSSSSSSGGGGAKVEGALFFSWVNEKIWQFLHILEEDLNEGVRGRLDSLLGQCMYFGLSFGRIGADFRSLIVPVFIRVLLNSFRSTLRNSKHEFHEAMKHLVLQPPMRALKTPPAISIATPFPSPPHSLLDYPPLATLTNAIIQAFNDLRQCPPLAVGVELANELRRLLESIVHDVREYHRVESRAFTTQDRGAYKQLVRVVAQDFLPFMRRIFENLFPEDKVHKFSLSTPYSLQRTSTPPSSSASGGGGGAGEGGVRMTTFKSRARDLKMSLDIPELVEPLRDVAGDVFAELEKMEKDRVEMEQSLATVRLEEEVGLEEEDKVVGQEEEGVKNGVEDVKETFGVAMASELGNSNSEDNCVES